MAKFVDFDEKLEYEDDDYYEKRPSNRNRKGKKKGMKTWVKVLIILVEVIIVLILLALWYFVEKMNKIHYTPMDRNAIVSNKSEMSQDTIEVLDGYTNILLLGSDSRDNTVEGLTAIEENHTDSIIVASINNRTKEVRLLSVYRDTLLQMQDTVNSKKPVMNKATEAMFFYGVEPTISMINTNCDLDIKDYIMVNWSALIEIIDAVGGIDIEINDTELYWLNLYLYDTSENTGVSFTELEHSGMVHLDGIQATAYCRIRYGGGMDFRRTERQRQVITLVLEKAKKMDIVKLNKAIDSIFGNVATSLDLPTILALAKDLNSYNLTETTGFPFDLKSFEPAYMGNQNIKDYLVPITLESNVSKLHQFLFDVDNYEPSSVVKDISKKLIDTTGAQ